MGPRSRPLLLYGRNEEPSEQKGVRAGALTALVDGANLRQVRVGGLELVQRIYAAVRDLSWNVIPVRISELVADVRDESFTITFHARHRHEDIDFSWNGTIAGTNEGSISYEMKGRAEASFGCNKLGLLVLHPVASHAGRRMRLTTPNGGAEVVFPTTVGPQAVREGKLRGLFPPFSEATIALDGGVELHLGFEGDLFEMEDERNWSEYSYKSYSGPLADPWPVRVERGQSIKQTIRVDLVKPPATHHSVKSRPARISLDADNQRATLPAIGFGLSTDLDRLTARETALLRPLQPDCLLLDLHPSQPGSLQELTSGAKIATDLNSSLLIALYVGQDVDTDVGLFMKMLEANEPRALRGLLVFEESPAGPVRSGTPVELVSRVHELLRPRIADLPIGGGSERYFSEVNRARLPFTGFDWIAFGVSPACHADEDDDVLLNVSAQRDVVLTLRQSAPGIPLVAGPITLQTRFGSWPRAPRPGELPLQVDPRQAALFGAVWTLGSIRELSFAGVALAVYYELAGWRGLIERDAGNPMPEHFASQPGDVLPLYHVFADLADLPRETFLADAPTGIVCVGFGDAGKGLELLVANLTPRAQRVTIDPFPNSHAAVRSLDERSAQLAMEDWLKFRSAVRMVPVENGRLVLDLLPYAYLRINQHAPLDVRAQSAQLERIPALAVQLDPNCFRPQILG